MSTNRRRIPRSKAATVEIDETISQALLHGPGSVERGSAGHRLLASRFFDHTKHRLGEFWAQHSDVLLAEWSKTNPGVTPWIVEHLARERGLA
jgi:hypothetical protein